MSQSGAFELDKLSRWNFQSHETRVIARGFAVEQSTPDLVKFMATHDDRFLRRAVPRPAPPPLGVLLVGVCGGRSFQTAAGQTLGQLGARSKEPGFNGANGPVNAVGDLLAGEALLVVGLKNEPGLGAKLVHSPFEFSGQVFVVAGAGARLRMVDGGRNGRQPLPAHAPGQRGAAAIGSNLQQPRPNGPSRVEPKDARRAGRNVSWVASSASCRWLSMRKQSPKTTP